MSIHPKTLAEHMANQARAKDRRHKRLLKRRQLGIGPDRTTVRAQLDHLSSLIVRRRDRAIHGGYCLVCMAKQRLGLLERKPNPIMLAYHIEPRGDDMTRWDLRNMVGACVPCNFDEKNSRNRASQKERMRQIHIELLGGGAVGFDALNELYHLATKTADFSTADLISMRDERKSQMEGGNKWV